MVLKGSTIQLLPNKHVMVDPSHLFRSQQQQQQKFLTNTQMLQNSQTDDVKDIQSLHTPSPLHVSRANKVSASSCRCHVSSLIERVALHSSASSRDRPQSVPVSGHKKGIYLKLLLNITCI